MEYNYGKAFSRNIGILSQSDQDKLRASSIAIAGMGGVGGLLAERLVRMGVEKLKIADPGTFELSNFNRQLYSSISNSGKNKAEVLFSNIMDINPGARINWSKTGIRTEKDASSFVKDCDIVVDEMDMGMFKESITLQRAARAKGIYYMFTVAYGFGALIALFDPHGMTLEEYNGLSSNVDITNPENLKVPFEKLMPIIPAYATEVDLETLKKMHNGETQGSAISIGAGLASILATNEITNLILKKRKIVAAPEYIYVDLMDQGYTVRSV
jgi:molybdopterin/thiamine biosynthesis adenylyltransferase